MATDEVENFVHKFKMLRDSGYDATLTLESKLGEVFVVLNCKVGRTTPPPTTPFMPISPRYRSPSYFRRQSRRKAAAKQECNNIVLDKLPCVLKADKVLENQEAIEIAADSSNDSLNAAEDISNKAEKPVMTPCFEEATTEVVDDESRNAEHDNVTDILDREEAERNKLVDEVIVYLVPPSDIRQSIQGVNDVDIEIKDKFSSIGVQVEGIRHRTNRGVYESSLVKIKPPVNLQKIWGRRLGLQQCAVIEYSPADGK